MGYNGKSTLFNVINEVFKPISRIMNKDVVVYKKEAQSFSPYCLELKDGHYLYFSESDSSMKWNESWLKGWAGMDLQQPRGIMKDPPPPFDPVGKVNLLINEKPTFQPDDSALFDRILFIPLFARFVENPDEKCLHEKLVDKNFISYFQKETGKIERQGMIKYLIEGAVDYFKNGLQIPQFCKDALKLFKEANNNVTTYMHECLVMCDQWTAANLLYKDYKEWCDENELEAVTSKCFGSILTKSIDKKACPYIKYKCRILEPGEKIGKQTQSENMGLLQKLLYQHML
jgi:putative DNA primase/helicase